MVSRTRHLIGCAVVTLGIAASIRADSLLVSGVGSSGSWTTRLEMANPTSSPLKVEVYLRGEYTPPCAFPACVPFYATIPPNGTASLSLDDALFNSTTYLQNVYITGADPTVLPVVRASATNSAPPNQTVVLPVVRLSTLVALNPQTLTFPAATRTDAVHSNIVIGAAAADGSNPLFAIRVDVFASNGTPVATGVFANTLDTQGQDGTNIFLVDVLSFLGVTNLEGGQIRVTKTAGDGALWGEMATLGSDGIVLMTQGLNP